VTTCGSRYLGVLNDCQRFVTAPIFTLEDCVKQSRYLVEYRLQDVLAALQFPATHDGYDLREGNVRTKIAPPRGSAKRWGEVFADHPKFFRQSEYGGDYSLILRRARPKEAYSRLDKLQERGR
jgi:hypothetical protein